MELYLVCAILAALSVALALTGYKVEWTQTLEVNISISGENYQGYGVISPSYIIYPIGQIIGMQAKSTATGQAVTIEVPGEGTLIILLDEIILQESVKAVIGDGRRSLGELLMRRRMLKAQTPFDVWGQLSIAKAAWFKAGKLQPALYITGARLKVTVQNFTKEQNYLRSSFLDHLCSNSCTLNCAGVQREELISFIDQSS